MEFGREFRSGGSPISFCIKPERNSRINTVPRPSETSKLQSRVVFF